MILRKFLPFVLVCLFFLQGYSAERPNVLFIIVDDLNDMPLHPDGKPLVPTPNIDRLKAQGVTFTNAHTNDPLCAPSRASMMFGLYPQTSSLYWFEDWRDNGIYKTSVSLENNLRNGGYTVFGTGKIYHGNQKGIFDEFGPASSVGPWPWDGRKATLSGFLPHPQQLFLFEGEDADMDYKWEHVFGSLSEIPDWPADPAQGIPGYQGWTLFGKPWRYVDSDDRDRMGDELIAAWTGEVLKRDHSKPFVLFTGPVRTHTPLYAPQNYFDRFPLDSIKLPKVDPHDLDDVSDALGNEALYGFRRYKMLVRHEGKDLFRKWLQAYMACVSFIDDQVGTILDALEDSPVRDHTIVFFTSDHGFHIGEKNFLYKGSLWEPSTRIPLVVAGVPGSAKGAICDHPVSLIDIYPTFNDLCGLSTNPNQDGNGYELEGHSIVPFLKDPENGTWDGPDVVITTIPGKNHMLHRVYEGSLYPHFSVRGKRWRYSLTSNGGEELYDHENDPLEWHNLAHDPEFFVIKAAMKEQLIELRDGNRWESLQSLRSWTMPSGAGQVEQRLGEIRLSGERGFELASVYSNAHFELEIDIKVSPGNGFRLAYRGASGDGVSLPGVDSEAARHSQFKPGQWNRYRIRVHNERHQLWINNRVVSDTLGTEDEAVPDLSATAANETHQVQYASDAGALRILYGGGPGSVQFRGARIRSLELIP